MIKKKQTQSLNQSHPESNICRPCSTESRLPSIPGNVCCAHGFRASFSMPVHERVCNGTPGDSEAGGW